MKSHIAIDINNEACDSKSSKAGIEDSCPVCMEIFKNCQKIFEYLPCHHFCCHVCTVKMKKFRQIEFKFLECPLCREKVTKKVKIAAFFPPLLPLPLFQFWMSNVTSFVKRVLRVPMFHFKNSWNMSIFSVSKLSAVRNSEEIISWVRKVFCQISKKSKVHFWIMYQLFHLFSSCRLNWFRKTIPWFQLWTKIGLWKDGKNNCKTSLNQRPCSRYAGLFWPYSLYCSSYCHISCHIFYKTLNQKPQMHWLENWTVSYLQSGSAMRNSIKQEQFLIFKSTITKTIN